jgi:hypothetical protein
MPTRIQKQMKAKARPVRGCKNTIELYTRRDKLQNAIRVIVMNGSQRGK